MSAPVLTHRLSLPLRVEMSRAFHSGTVTTADNVVPNLTLVVNECNTLIAERDAALARVAVLAAALEDACDVALWMSGSSDFSQGGTAHAGWQKMRPKLHAAMAARAATDAAGEGDPK